MDNSNVDLPSWFCRGIVTDTSLTTSDVFLIDHGIVVEVPNGSMVRYSIHAIPIEPLSYPLCIYNILPLDSEQK